MKNDNDCEEIPMISGGTNEEELFGILTQLCKQHPSPLKSQDLNPNLVVKIKIPEQHYIPASSVTNFL